MPLSTKAKAKRSTNQRERQDRRREIQARWDRRLANLAVSRQVAQGHSIRDLVSIMLHEGKWAPHEDLIEYLNPTDLKPILAYCLRVIELKEMDYQDYLETPEWKENADQAKQKYRGKCALDDTHDAVDAHHRTYARRGREWPSDLIALCRDCHTKHHKR